MGLRRDGRMTQRPQESGHERDHDSRSQIMRYLVRSRAKEHPLMAKRERRAILYKNGVHFGAKPGQ